jgi:TonB-linked SusC/RagA family outer membrane protein
MVELFYLYRKSKWYIFISLIMIEGFIPFVSAQEAISIRGKVFDERTKEAIVGASILIKNTANGTASDVNGNFILNVDKLPIFIEISYLGYKSQEIDIYENSAPLTVFLTEDFNLLNEVVVVGYGTVKRKDLTGAVSDIKSERLLDRPSTNAGQALQGRFAGVDVYQNSGAPNKTSKIRIRGENSINSSNDPLWVVDGIVGIWNASSINPNDIESLELLKDASATAIYGARGANGVIIVTTKKGINGKPVISYEGYLTISKASKFIALLNAEEFMQIYNTSFDNTAKYDPVGTAQGKYKRNLPENFPDLFNPDGTSKYDTDWQDEIYRTAVGHNHQFNIRGGSDQFRYGIFAGVLQQPGILDRTEYDRYSGKVTLDGDLNQWLSVSSFISVNHNKSNMLDDQTLNGSGSISRFVLEALPIAPVKLNGRYSTQTDFPGWEAINPVKKLYESENVATTYQTLASIAFTAKITKDLEFKTSFSTDLASTKTNNSQGSLVAISQKGTANISNSTTQFWQNENYLTFDKTFRQKHHITALAGLSWQRRYTENFSAATQNFVDDFYQWHNLGVGTVFQRPSSSDSQWSINSYFARLNYVFADKYLFTATGRIDGSSKFGINNKYAAFPSAAVAWRISEEDFLKGNKTISDLKIRASIGQTGNQEIDLYQSLQFLGTSQIILGDAYYTAMYKSSFGNSDLKWEKTTQYDAGVDVNFFSDRVSLTADYYYKKTEDMLLLAPLPYTSGMESVMTNIGSLKNEGVELSLNTINARGRNFEWSSRLSWSRNRNKILKLGINDEDIFPGPLHQINLTILRVGEPIGAFWGRVREGIWSEAEAAEAAKYDLLPGDVKHADLNKDGVINEKDEQIIGHSAPDWVGNFSNTVRWNGLDFTLDLRWVFGAQIYNTTKMTTVDRSTIANNQKETLNAWTPGNQNTMIPERRPTSIRYDNKPDTYKIEDGSYLRGQNAVLGYTLPQNISKQWNISQLRFYVSAQNLFCINNYSGYDPEVQTYAGSSTLQNLDFYSYPKAKTFTLGLNLSF